ncbi:response regulator transcription factor [Halomonas elongata]|uniref:response regulator transcription factor n=1 Tax=Halomonas elongata TaxID=2746 RepID=UPI00186BAD5D|nr:LuxR C-terminal-related transcriptional regulator [Halomonas elongata]MBW5800095.1 LuxR C-terminal-related transcriptional regulator [Halomonas elongata]
MQLTFGSWRAIANPNRTQGELAPREAQHLMALASGMTAKEIAREFGVSVSTVRHSLKRIYGRLGVERSTAAVAGAIRRGWIAPLALALMLADLHGHALRTRQPMRTRQQSSSTYRSTRRDLGSVLA